MIKLMFTRLVPDVEVFYGPMRSHAPPTPSTDGSLSEESAQDQSVMKHENEKVFLFLVGSY